MFAHEILKNIYAKNKAFVKIVSLISKTGISPNTITFFAAVSIVAGIYFIYLKELVLGGASIIAFIIFDGLDGAVARNQGRETEFGKWLDAIMHIMWNIIYIVLAYSGFISWEIASLAVFVSFAGTLVIKTGSESIKKKAFIFYDATPLLIFSLFFGFVFETVILIIILNSLFIFTNVFLIIKRSLF